MPTPPSVGGVLSESRNSGPRSGLEAGQASVSFVAVLPLAPVACLVVAQAGVVGYSAWSAAGAARAGARAELVGEPVSAAARDALPTVLERRSSVAVDRGSGEVEVELSAPRLLPLLPRLGVSGSAALRIDGAGGG